jgi:hypothetical protein
MCEEVEVSLEFERENSFSLFHIQYPCRESSSYRAMKGERKRLVHHKLTWCKEKEQHAFSLWKQSKDSLPFDYERKHVMSERVWVSVCLDHHHHQQVMSWESQGILSERCLNVTLDHFDHRRHQHRRERGKQSYPLPSLDMTCKLYWIRVI